MSLPKEKGEDLVKESAKLRGQGNVQQAYDLIMDDLDAFNDITLLPALIQALYAAKELGDQAKMLEVAKLIYAEDPNVPSIRGIYP